MFEVKWSFVLESRCAGGPAVRAALFANVSSPVSAVLPLVFFFPSRSSVFFCVPKLPAPRVRKDLRFAHHHSFLFCGLSPFLRLTSNLVLIRAGVPSLSPSFIHAYSYVQSCLVLCVQAQTAKNKRFFFFPPSYSFSITEKLNTLKTTEKSAILRIIFKANSSGTKEERGGNLIFYFTHHQHWREDSRNALWCIE